MTVVREACALVPRPLVIGISGAATASEAFALSQAGARTFLVKPFSPRKFVTTIESALVDHELDELRAGHLRAPSRPTQRVLAQALRRIAERYTLNDHHVEMATMLLHGTSRSDLAAALGVSENTCKKNVRRLLARLRLPRVAAVRALVLDEHRRLHV
jgi:DNA-binding NarL/FixJ family response regulator